MNLKLVTKKKEQKRKVHGMAYTVERVGEYVSVCVCVCVCARAHARTHAQSCLTLFDSMDCSPPGSSVYVNFKARILD